MSSTFYTSNDVSGKQRVKKKKLLGRNSKAVSLQICYGSHLWRACSKARKRGTRNTRTPYLER